MRRNLVKFLILIFVIFVATFIVHISSYVYSGFNIDSITQQMYISEDSEVHLMFNSENSLNYIINGEAYFLNFTLENGHVKAYKKLDDEKAFINFYFIKKGILDTTNNIFLLPLIIE